MMIEIDRERCAAGGRRGGQSRSEKKLEALKKNREKAGRPSKLELTVDEGGGVRARFTQAGRERNVENVDVQAFAGGVWRVRLDAGRKTPFEWRGPLVGFPAAGAYVLPYKAKHPKRPGAAKPSQKWNETDWLYDRVRELEAEVARLRAALLEGFQI